MKINEMNSEERLALGSLVRTMVGKDGSFSREESSELAEIAKELGADGFWAAVDEAGQLDMSEDAVMARARAVERVDARETIYATVANIAESGSVMGTEASLLDWLTAEWGLQPLNVPDEG